ncbi:MAG: PAS domain S-box protein [Bacillus sp. (in: Bacteria)]|nr:PAS domain S-box protein [Bacillus sp. (in: firmicutes)]
MHITSRNIPFLLWLTILICLMVPMIIDYTLFPDTPLTIYLLFLLPIIIFPFYYSKEGIFVGTILINSLHILWGIVFLPIYYEMSWLNRIINHFGLTIVSFAIAFFLYKLIKEMKQRELQIQENKDLYQNVVEISPNPILILQSDNIVYANNAAVQLTGLSSSKEFTDYSIEEFMSPSSKDIYHERIKTIIEGGIPNKPIEYELIRPDGKNIYIETLGKQIIYQGEPAILAVGK